MDTIYSLFQKVVKEHENAPAIIENDRAMTFGELSNMVDMITQLSAGSTQHRHRHASPNRDDCLDSGGTQMRRPICPSRAGFSHRAHP